MNSHLPDLDRLLLILFAVLFLKVAWKLYAPRFRRRWKRVKARLPRRWKPRSPKDCPHCCQGLSLESRPVQREVEPYAERKKEIPTAGFACLNPLWDFFGITDDQVHALVGNGKRGIKHDIQHFRCQWCRTDFSCRRNTPLYYLKTAPDRIEMVLWLMAEGVDISVMVRYTGHADSTISRWLQRMGNHSILLHNRYFQGLVLTFVQLDELYAKVRTGVQWLWLAIDPVTKIIPSLHLGGRKQEDAYALLHDLHLRLDENCVPAFTSDGLRSYFYAITSHFGYWLRPERARTDHWHVADDLLYGQLIKRKQRYRLTFIITRMLWGSRTLFYQLLADYGSNSTIQTAFIERVNLTSGGERTITSSECMTRFSYLFPVSQELAFCVRRPWLLASHNNSGRSGRFSKCRSTRPSLDRPDALGEHIAAGTSAFQGLEFRTIWLRSRHLTGALLASWSLFTSPERPSAVKPIIRRSRMQDLAPPDFMWLTSDAAST